jgi:hypothetical protein
VVRFFIESCNTVAAVKPDRQVLILFAAAVAVYSGATAAATGVVLPA